MGFRRVFKVIWGIGWPAAAVFCLLRGRRRARRQVDRAANPPLPDERLDAVRRAIEEAVGSAAGGEGVAAEEPGEAALVGFRSRYSVEREVRNLWRQSFGEEAPRRGLELLIEPLVREGALSPEMAWAIEMVSRVASPAVHAQPISEAKVRFLQEVAPRLTAALREIGEVGRG